MAHLNEEIRKLIERETQIKEYLEDDLDELMGGLHEAKNSADNAVYGAEGSAKTTLKKLSKELARMIKVVEKLM